MNVDKQFLEFIGDIYEASYRPGQWDVAMAKLCQLVQAKSAGIFLWDHQTKTQSIMTSNGLSTLARMSYRFGLAKYDHVYNIMVDREIGKGLHVVKQQDIKVTNPLFYRFLLKPNDIGYISAINICRDDEVYLGMAVHRPFDAPAFTDGELEMLELSVPHIQRAFRIQRELQQLRSREQSLKSALSRLALGVVVVGDDNRIHYLNPMAESILAQHPGLRLVAGQLKAHYPDEDAHFHDLLASLKTADVHDVETRHLAVSLHHPSRKMPLTVMMSTLNEIPDHLNLSSGGGRVVLYLSDPESPSNLSYETLNELYGLTPSEARVAVGLVNGLELRQIAEQHQVTFETIRGQLRLVFQKMGVNKQQDVVRVLLGGAVSIQ